VPLSSALGIAGRARGRDEPARRRREEAAALGWRRRHRAYRQCSVPPARYQPGRLPEAELRTEEASRLNWLAIDRNGDGRISASEFTTAIPPGLPDRQQAGVSR
jgi:hypothetical protein